MRRLRWRQSGDGLAMCTDPEPRVLSSPLYMESARLLEVSDLRVEFPRAGGCVRAARGVALSVDEGQIVALVGESGSGKSASALGMIKLVPPPGRVTGGVVCLDGVDLLQLEGEELRRRRGAGIAYIPQEPGLALSPVLTLGAQIVDVIRAHRATPRREAFREAVVALARVGIPDPELRVREYAHEFSGGMKQRALIALALAAHPRLLIADEPTTAIDVSLQAGILELFRTLVDAGELGGVVLITHDLGVVAAVCDRVLVMYAGRIVEEASVTKLFEDPRHPYTRALMASMPAPEVPRGELPTIPGQVPDLMALPAGCAFHPRCQDAVPACSSKDPVLAPSSSGGRVACLLEEGR